MQARNALDRGLVAALVIAVLAFLLPWGAVPIDEIGGGSGWTLAGIGDEVRVRLGSNTGSIGVLWLEFPNWLACAALAGAAGLLAAARVQGKPAPGAVGPLALYAGVHTAWHLVTVWFDGGRWGLAHLAMFAGVALVTRCLPPKRDLYDAPVREGGVTPP